MVGVAAGTGPRHVAFAGLDGVGKSTQAVLLCRQFRAAGVDAYLLDHGDDHAFQRLRAAADHQGQNHRSWFGHPSVNVALALDSLRTYELRLAPQLSAGRTVVEAKSKFGLLAWASVLDGSNVDQMESLLELAPSPDLCFYLRASPEVCQTRIGKRGLDVESTEELKALEDVLEVMSRDRHWIVIDGSQDVLSIHEAVWRSLAH